MGATVGNKYQPSNEIDQSNGEAPAVIPGCLVNADERGTAGRRPTHTAPSSTRVASRKALMTLAISAPSPSWPPVELRL
jgi:hypothetical protein